jgi:hypothetical protein
MTLPNRQERAVIINQAIRARELKAAKDREEKERADKEAARLKTQEEEKDFQSLCDRIEMKVVDMLKANTDRSVFVEIRKVDGMNDERDVNSVVLRAMQYCRQHDYRVSLKIQSVSQNNHMEAANVDGVREQEWTDYWQGLEIEWD